MAGPRGGVSGEALESSISYIEHDEHTYGSLPLPPSFRPSAEMVRSVGLGRESDANGPRGGLYVCLGIWTGCGLRQNGVGWRGSCRCCNTDSSRWSWFSRSWWYARPRTWRTVSSVLSICIVSSMSLQQTPIPLPLAVARSSVRTYVDGILQSLGSASRQVCSMRVHTFVAVPANRSVFRSQPIATAHVHCIAPCVCTPPHSRTRKYIGIVVMHPSVSVYGLLCDALRSTC